MTYRIARNGQIYGPYSVLQLQRHLASGQIAPTDLAQAEGMEEWLPVEKLFPAAPMHERDLPGGLPRLFPDPPDLRWWVALLLGIVTLGAFFVLWDVVEAAWFRRAERSSWVLGWYIAAATIYLLKLPGVWHSIAYNVLNGPLVSEPYAGVLTIAGLLIAIIARFVFRAELLRHFNRAEPIGLGLNWSLTLLFGGLYFQYHFNRINEVKRALHVSVPSV